MQAVDTALGQGVNAVMIVVTNQGLGPAIVEKCRAVNVALMTIDDTIKDDKGEQIFHVGINTRDLGYYGAKALVELARQKGFFKEGNVVKLMLVDLSILSVTHERTPGYIEGFKEFMPEVNEADYVNVDSTPDGMIESAMRVVSAGLSAHPEVTHWLITGINGDGAIGAMRVFEERNFLVENLIACGLGGYELSLNEFKKDHSSYICTILFPNKEGKKAVELLYDNLIKGTSLSTFTQVLGKVEVATHDNWQQFFPDGKLPW